MVNRVTRKPRESSFKFYTFIFEKLKYLTKNLLLLLLLVIYVINSFLCHYLLYFYFLELGNVRVLYWTRNTKVS